MSGKGDKRRPRSKDVEADEVRRRWDEVDWTKRVPVKPQPAAPSRLRPTRDR